MLTPLAVEVARGRQLPAGGTPPRRRETNRDHQAWERFMAGYAELQREVTRHAE